MDLLGTNQVCVPIFALLQLLLCYVTVLLQMYNRSSRSKDHVIDLTSSLVSKRTRNLSDDSVNERFKTPLDSQTFFSIFKSAPTVVEWIVRFDTLGSTFIPKIFADKDWTNLFETSRIQLMNWLRSST